MDDAQLFFPKRRRWLLGVLIAVAAVAVVLWRRDLPGASTRSAGPVEAATRIGQRRTLRLDDGTQVDLSVSSILHYPSVFPATSRPVTLVGEGFFAVAKDTARPFVVTAGQAAVTTTGAAFGVRAYPGQNAVQVVVDSGEVRLRAGTAPTASGTVIGARTVARLARDGAVTRSDSIDPEYYLGWRRGRIVFNGLPLRAALVELSRWQNVNLRIGDSVVANRRVTATFASHQTLTEMLDGIALQSGARYEREGNTITFFLER